ncbi:748_t:CDS:2 [Funneliformis geosporum]|nr:748_t:CDS:2 [Funneliformis geosporum]
MTSSIPGGLQQPLQGMSYNSPSSKDLFRLANITYQRQSEVSPTYVADILSKATTTLMTKLTFTFSIIDKPQEGQIYLISLSPNAVDIPSDGYVPKELLCMERSQGFAPGDQVTSKVRRRYRFANDHQELQLLHYASLDERQRQMVQPFTRHPTPGRYPMPPMQAGMNPYGRPSNSISPMAIQSPGPSSIHNTSPAAMARGPTGTLTPMGNAYQFQSRITGSNNQRGIPPGMVMQNPTKSVGRRTKGAKNKASIASVAAVAEEIEEPSGGSIIPPTSIYQEQNVDELKQQLTAHQEDIEKLKTEHSKKVEEFKRHSNILSKSMNDLSKCNTMEELLKLQERTEKELDIVIQPCNPITLIHIHNGPESDVEDEGPNDMMQDDVIGGELLIERNPEHRGLVELDQELSSYGDLVNTHNTSGIEEIEAFEGLKDIQGIEGMGGIDTSGLHENDLQRYFSPANIPGLANEPNLQLGGLTGDTNIGDNSNYTGDPNMTINTNFGGDSSQMFEDFINNPDETMDDEIPLA